MKYKLLEDHQVRLSDQVLKSGIYTLEELEEAHKHDSLNFCLNHTKLKNKIVLLDEDFVEPAKTNKRK